MLMNYLLRLEQFFQSLLVEHTQEDSQLVALLFQLSFVCYLPQSLDLELELLLFGESCDCHRPLQHTRLRDRLSLLIELALFLCLIVGFRDESS